MGARKVENFEDFNKYYQFLKSLMASKGVSLNSTHASLQHANSTQRSLVFSPQVCHQHTCMEVTCQSDGFLLKWRVEMTNLCWSDVFVLKWHIELTRRSDGCVEVTGTKNRAKWKKQEKFPQKSKNRQNGALGLNWKMMLLPSSYSRY